MVIELAYRSSFAELGVHRSVLHTLGLVQILAYTFLTEVCAGDEVSFSEVLRAGRTFPYMFISIFRTSTTLPSIRLFRTSPTLTYFNLEYTSTILLQVT